MKSFIEKYKPKSTEEIPQSLEMLKALIKNKKHALVYGQTGSCKTVSIYLIANELNYEVLEINASDFRTKDKIDKSIGQASKQQSLFQREKILLIEEADCLAGREDRGGAVAISNVLKESKFPVIITCNNPYDDKLKELRKKLQLIEFKPINTIEINKILKKICQGEKIKFSEIQLLKIAEDSMGDIRAAINDLQSNIIENELILRDEKRDKENSMMEILSSILKDRNFHSNMMLENTDLEELSLWLDENLPLQYKDRNELLKSYELMSRADIFKGRIRKWQYWRLMYYQSLLMSSGISVAKSTLNQTFTQFKRPMRLLKIWQSNIKNAKKKAIVSKLAKVTHTSTKIITKNFSQYKTILKNRQTINELKLDQDEIEFLNT